MTTNESTESPAVLTVIEAAARLRVSRWMIYDAIRTGEIAAMRLGRVYRVPLSEVERLLAGTPLNR